MHIFGVTLQCAFKNLKCSIIGWPTKSTLPSILIASCLVSTPWNLIPVEVVIGVTPLSPRKKSKCHQERRNSPSVASFKPTSACFLMIFSISRSSISFNAAASISPLANLARASFSGAGRSRLPTMSARKGGVARWVIIISPLLSNYHAREGGHPVNAGLAILDTLRLLGPGFRGDDINYFPHTSSANSTIIFSLAHCSSSASTLPSSVEAKPHCGERQR